MAFEDQVAAADEQRGLEAGDSKGGIEVEHGLADHVAILHSYCYFSRLRL